MPDAGAEVLDEDRAPGTVEPATERASFRLAAFGALLIVVLFAGYGLGRLGASMPAPTGGTVTTQGGNDAATPPGEAADGHGHDTAPGGTAPHDDSGTAPQVSGSSSHGQAPKPHRSSAG